MELEAAMKPIISAIVSTVVAVVMGILAAAGVIVPEDLATMLAVSLPSLAVMIVGLVFLVRSLRAARKQDAESRDTGTFTPPPSAERGV